MAKKHILCFFASLRARRGLALAPLIEHSRARSVPVHPCTGRRSAKNTVSHQPADTMAKKHILCFFAALRARRGLSPAC